ncbi:MAG: hypothetical protein L0Y66_06230 [Myxococcaceae bacterium]|nr:hypothetical protein [Myxococcaceae bacterium]MCI0671205.1 hypothetical protein [Myxococcaceae bacterium]
MNILYSAHSGLRYLVVLVALAAIAYFAYGLATKKPAGKAVRILGSTFVGLVDLQILLGLLMVALGRFYPALIGHIVLMVLAAGVVHTLLVLNRKRATPGFTLPLVAVLLGLALIWGGIAAIQRGLFQSIPYYPLPV